MGQGRVLARPGWAGEDMGAVEGQASRSLANGERAGGEETKG
jgi:hypothetical protein